VDATESARVAWKKKHIQPPQRNWCGREDRQLPITLKTKMWGGKKGSPHSNVFAKRKTQKKKGLHGQAVENLRDSVRNNDGKR